MGYTYCTKLSVDSAAITDNTSFDPSYGFPFAGFVNFTTLDNDEYDSSKNKNDPPNPFEKSQDYLQRWDSFSGMIDPKENTETKTAICSEANGTCVKINDMYCSTVTDFPYTNQEGFSGNKNKKFLSMVPLAKAINDDGRGLSFFMDMESEIKTEKQITLPYNVNNTKSICIDFCAAGFCKSNIPYIGLEYISRMMNRSFITGYYKLYKSSTARDDIFGKSEEGAVSSERDSSTNLIKTYELPGQGKLLLSPYTLYAYNDNGLYEYAEDLSGVISSALNYDKYSSTSSTECLVYKLCESIFKVINSSLYIKPVNDVSIRIDGENDAQGYTVIFVVTELPDGSNEDTITKNINNIASYFKLLSYGAIYYKNNNGEFEYKNQIHFTQISLGKIDNNTPGIELSKYIWRNVNIGSGTTSCSIYKNSLLYYTSKGEKFKLRTGTNSGEEYTLYDNIDNDTYFFVIRSISDTFSLWTSGFDIYTCDAATAYLGKCNSTIEANALYNRMDLYPDTSGSMIFFNNTLDKNDYNKEDSSIFKPRTLKYPNQTNLYTNYIPAFTDTPKWSDSSMSKMGVIEEEVDIKFNGDIYVSEVTLVFDGSTIMNLPEESTITVGTLKRNINDTNAKENSNGNIEFNFTFDASTSPAKISSSKFGKPTKNNMNVYTVGAQQMLKYCSFPGYDSSKNTTFDSIYRLDYDSSNNSSINPEDSQMTFTKMTGRIPVYISGSGIYRNDDTKVKLISTYIKLTDDSSLDVSINTLCIDSITGYPSSSEDSSTSTIGVLDWMGGVFKIISPANNVLSYTVYQPFLGSMSGDIPRYLTPTDSSYNMGVLSFTSSNDEYKSKIGLDSSNKVICVGPNYNKSSANANDASFGTLKTFSDSNSAYATDLTFTELTYDLGLPNTTGTRGTSVGADSSVYYSISKNPFISETSIAIANQLNNNDGSTYSTYIDFLLPTAHLNTFLVYDSVEFNRASAWTFMRSMPLQPGSANAPHILIYKVEAWVTKAEDEVDEKATKSMYFDYESSNIFSGYVNDANYKSEIHDGSVYKLCVKGINELINDHDFLNNCYLKVDDGGNTEELNAVGTAFPIIDITGNDVSYYGAPGLTAKIYSNIESFEDNSVDVTNDNDIYNELFSRAKEILDYDSSTSSEGSEGAQVVVLSYCDSSTYDLKPSSTGSGDKRKIIYICVGFYNNREEMIPINGKFGITYTVTTGSGDDTTDTKYTKYMYLSEFFPKDSMIYLAGKNYKNNTEKEENNKFAFVTDSIKNTYTNLIGDGLNTNDKPHNAPDNSEIINIGPGDSSTSYEIAFSSKSNGHWGDVSVEGVTQDLEPYYTGHYGILNRYTGKVSFVSNVPYNDYTVYTNSLEGKCLLNYEHICYFPNKTGVITLI